MQLDEHSLTEKLHPYVVFLPKRKKKIKFSSAIFGSKAGVDILRFSPQARHRKKHLPKRPRQNPQLLKQNHHRKPQNPHQTRRPKRIHGKKRQRRTNHLDQNLPTHQPRQMVRPAHGRRKRAYLKQKKPKSSKALFRTYVKQVKRLAEEIGINKKMLEETFREEMKSSP